MAMPYLVKIGNRGVHLRNITHWRYQPGGSPSSFNGSSLIVYFTTTDGTEAMTCQAFEVFVRAEADALYHYLDDMSVDVVLQAQIARERGEVNARAMAAIRELPR